MKIYPSPITYTDPEWSFTSPDICHTWCCRNVDLALCGEDLTDAGLAEDDDNPCVVCEDLEDGMVDAWGYEICPRGFGICPDWEDE